MRDRQVIEKEMYRAREDLESSLAELKHAVREKIDVKDRARVALEKGKQRAGDAFDRGKARARLVAQKGGEQARLVARRGSDQAYVTYQKAKERPVLTASVVGGIVASSVLVYVVGRRRCWW